MTLNALGLFEMCNPHLLATETLSDAIKTRLCVPVFNSSRSSLGQYYLINLELCKRQRILNLFLFQLKCLFGIYPPKAKGSIVEITGGAS